MTVVRAGVLRLLATLPDARVAEAETAQEALALFKAKRFDMYVLDIDPEGTSTASALAPAADPSGRR